MVLYNENAKLPTFTVSEGTAVSIWGVVTAIMFTVLLSGAPTRREAI